MPQSNINRFVGGADSLQMLQPCIPKSKPHDRMLPCGSQVPLYAQCGGWSAPSGINAPDPGLCCLPDTLCRFHTKDFWQCQPRGYAAPPEAPAVYDSSCGAKVKVG